LLMVLTRGNLQIRAIGGPNVASQRGNVSQCC
jgi:hypothetical protein